jgi:hypothetical protein
MHTDRSMHLFMCIRITTAGTTGTTVLVSDAKTMILEVRCSPRITIAITIARLPALQF